MSESSDDEIISPMGKNRTRLFSSDSEEEIVTNNLNLNRKRNRIIQQYSSSEDEDPNNNGEKTDASYIQKVRKIKRNSGKRYCTQTGNIVPEKIFENKDCGCRNACTKNFNVEERKNIFEKFWGLADFNKQNVLLHEAVERKIVERRRPTNGKGSPRNYSFRYLLTSRNGKIPVCKKFFLDTFKVSEGRLKRVLNSVNVGNDLRGRMVGSSRQLSDEGKKHVQNHIKSFPNFESHYTRSHNPNRKYLHPNLTLRKMFNLYELYCEENGIKAVNEWTYRKIFKKDFDLHFHQPRKDTCQKCDLLNIKIKASNNDDEKNKLTEEHDVHLKLAESARNSLKQDQEQVSRNSDYYFAFSFDLQKALPYPKLTTSVAYYKRNMYILNFGIHNFHNDNVHMYLWDETIASRGAQEVVSCILKHIKSLRNERHIIAYSDLCTGQNRNIKVALMWLKIVQTLENNVEVIDHKFLISGHSFLPNDRDFGVVEMALKKNNLLYVPQDYYKIIKKCRKGNNFIINEMRQEDFVSTKLLEDAIFRRAKNSDGESVNWLRICWMRFVRNEPYKIFYKTSMNDNENFKVLNLLPRRGRPRKFENIVLTPLYNNIRQITTAKFKDMIDLLRYIPSEHHDYFKSLSHAQNVDE